MSDFGRDAFTVSWYSHESASIARCVGFSGLVMRDLLVANAVWGIRRLGVQIRSVGRNQQMNSFGNAGQNSILLVRGW